MRASAKLALFATGALVTLAWPGPAGADTSLGGYSGAAQAEPIHIQIYEPTIPIPTTPQIDGSIGYTRSTTDTGPTSRATASYLWPGDTVGDGFGALTGNDKSQYPVQVNSRVPATNDSPAHNKAQLTDGNGMQTSATQKATRARVTGAGIAGPGTDLLGGIGSGLSNLPGLGGGTKKPTKPTSVPIPVSKALGALVTADGVRSDSDIVLGKNKITSTAHTHVSELKILGGVLSLGSVDITAVTTSNGKKATSTGHATVGSVMVGGQVVGLDEKGLNLAGNSVKVPKLPSAMTDALRTLGIEIKYLTTKHSVKAATGSFAAQGMTITIDTAPIKRILGLGPVLAQVGDALGKIPKLGDQLAPIAGLGPKIVLTVGDVTSTATAAPAFTGGTPPPPNTNPGGTTPPAKTGGGTTTTGGGGTTTGGGGDTGGGSVDTGGSGGGDTTTGGGGGGSDTGGTTPVAVQTTGLDLPALGAVPRMLLLGALVLALGAGWLLNSVGGFLLGGAGGCAYGAPSGVPDLRASD